VADLRIVGVRHHSPACARVVRHVIAETRPWAVLIEGPSDMNGRLAELTLPHAMPVAVYSYFLPRDQAAGAHGSWAPFCAYSPEWVALHAGLAVGACVRFIDLPAWDPVFSTVQNRYSDHEQQVSHTLHALAVGRGFDSTDALWDHLFELTDDPVRLERQLADYFDGFRGRVSDARTDMAERDPLREAYMARWIDWALSQAPAGATVLVVCGGFHKPALHALVGAAGAGADGEPTVPVPDTAAARTGSYLVPFSFARLDSFTGYAAGMPSPAFYEEVWTHGDAAAERMLWRAVARLRARGQRVSTADAIAASELAQGLAQLRGHRVPTRCDVLDGLAGALIKEALRVPPPWSQRGPLPAGTDPYLVEVLRAFSGEQRGALAAGTPRPPLVDDIERVCREVSVPLDPEPKALTLDVYDREAVERRTVLYRLLWLELPGVELVTTADLRRGRTRTTEAWRTRRTDETTVAMIERAVYGATLEAAALARIDEQLRMADGVAAIVTSMERALRAGFHHLVDGLCAAAATAVAHEPLFANVGEAVHRLATLQATEALPAGHGLGALLGTMIERGLFLLEGLEGATAPLDRPTIAGIASIRGALDLDLPDLEFLVAQSVGVWTRRLAAERAPPAVRGACLGALWTLAPAPDHVATAHAVIRGVPSPLLGEMLGGLFALAREAARESDLIDVVDVRLGALDDAEFLVTLPSLRRAFAYFPPSERRELARHLLSRRGAGTVEVQDLLTPVVEPELVAGVRQLEERWFATALRYGLIVEAEAS